MNVKTEICKAFSNHALQYEQNALIQQEIGERLFERLQYLKIKPRYILDLGCGPGIFSKQLKKYYPESQVVGLDLAYPMLQRAKAKQGWRCKWSLVRSDMTAMPFASGLFDLIFANQVVHWSSSFSAVLSELNRVMNTGGCLMFSTLGPDTFYELRKAWALVDDYEHVNSFMDMHDIGDDLLVEHFMDPVVDMERVTACYSSLSQLLRTLKAQGVRNINAARNPGLTGRLAWQRFEQAVSEFRTENGKFPLTYEVIYGHAWKGSQRRTTQGIETIIPIETLRKTQK